MIYPRFVNLVRLVWLLAIGWYELATFYHHTSVCSWPDIELASLEHPLKLTHVLVVADPQILDKHSYPDRPPWLVRLSQLIVDLNLRKSWRAALSRHPDAVVFLGDMMDNGRLAVSDDEYETYFRRFKDIFAADKSLPIYYLPGNHDVGLGTSSPRYQFSDHAVERYTSHFGVLNQRITIANHTVWLIDAPGLVDEERERASAGMSFTQWAEARPDRTIGFVQSYANHMGPEFATGDANPILFTHVPLSRPEGSSCGPLRERGTIRQGRGLGYQNLLTPQASELLLQTIRPAIVFSGDDHDYCEYIHTVPSADNRRPPASVPEISVKSFSMAMGIRRPGYQLLSLLPPTAARTGNTIAHRPCLLPDQLGIYLSVYLPFIGLTLVALLVANVRRVRTRHDSPTTRSGDSMYLSVRRDDAEAGAGVDYDLPPPSAWRSKEFARPWWSCARTVSLGSSRRRLTVSSDALVRSLLSFLWTGSERAQDADRYRRAGVVKGFLRDFWDAAWAPLGLFVAIAWWVW